MLDARQVELSWLVKCRLSIFAGDGGGLHTLILFSQ